MPRRHPRIATLSKAEIRSKRGDLHKPAFPISVTRRLLVAEVEWEIVQDAIRVSSPAATHSTARLLGRAGVSLLTERTINVGARKSNNFHKLSTEELKQEIEASLPDSAPHVLTYPVERVIVVGGFVPYLAWLLRDAQEVANEQSRLHETICRLSGVALPSYRSEPFVSLAKFHGGYISEATVAAAEKNKPDYIDLAPVAIMPTKALTDQ